MDEGLTGLPFENQGFWFEGYTWGLDEGRRECEQLREDHKHETQVLWHVILGLRHEFTLNAGVRK